MPALSPGDIPLMELVREDLWYNRKGVVDGHYIIAKESLGHVRQGQVVRIHHEVCLEIIVIEIESGIGHTEVGSVPNTVRGSTTSARSKSITMIRPVFSFHSMLRGSRSLYKTPRLWITQAE